MSFAFVFPGQGSQGLKMMDGIKDLGVVKTLFEQAADILGVDLLAMLDEDNTNNINQTVNTQPLMLVAGYATYLAWIEQTNKSPSIVAGHSLGEWRALVASGVIKIEDAISLVRIRAQAMQNAVPVGSGVMAAVLGLDDDKVVAICNQVSSENNGVISAVNFNSPGQVVIAGEEHLFEDVANKLKDAGAKKVQKLQVSVPAHCGLMQGAANQLAHALNNIEFSLPKTLIIQNADAKIHNDIASIKDALIKQVYTPVLWSQTIKYMVNNGTNNIVECGPGKVLTGLNKRIDSTIVSYNLHNQENIQQVCSAV